MRVRPHVAQVHLQQPKLASTVLKISDLNRRSEKRINYDGDDDNDSDDDSNKYFFLICALSVMLTATRQIKPAKKSLKMILYCQPSHRLDANVMLSHVNF